jgi:hypothetical protein
MAVVVDRLFAPAELGGYEPYTHDLRVELRAGTGHFLHEQYPQLVCRRQRAQVLRPTPRSGARSDNGLSSQSIAQRPGSRTLRWRPVREVG